MSFERKVVSALLFDPSEIHNIELSTKWIFDKRNKEIVQAIKETDGEERDLVVLADLIKKNNSLTKVTDEYIYDLSSETVTAANIEKHVRLLKKDYLNDQLAISSKKFAENPTLENKENMQHWLIEIEQMKVEEDDGSLNEAADDFFHSLEHEAETGILTYPSVDEVLGGGMMGGQLITIGARPGIGKTAFSVNLAIEALAHQENARVDFFTLEMSKGQMLNRFISRIGDINSYDLRNPFKNLDNQKKETAVEVTNKILSTGLRIFDKQFNIDQIVRQIRKGAYESKGKPYIVFIDYLGLISTKDQRQQRYLQIGQITRALKLLTNELEIPIVLMTQLNRGLESRQNKEPVLSDIRESGDVEQDSNVVMFLHEPEEENHTTDVIVAKNREGALRKLKFNFLKSKMFFGEAYE